MPRHPLATTARVAAVCVFTVLGLQAGGRAHHVAGHDQNPNPPANLGPTTILHFDAGSLIIPMDGCYARPSFMANAEIDAVVAPLNRTTAKCNGTSEKDDGLIPAYTLMFRLIRAGIPVNWAIRYGKTGWNDYDFQVVRAGGGPVAHRNPGGATDATKYAGITTLKYRGAPFVIDASHAAAALALMDSYAGICSTGTCYKEVDVHVAAVGFDAPIYRTIDAVPKLAVIDLTDGATALSNEKTNFTAGSIDEALMADLEGTVFDWKTIPQVLAGALDAGDYDLVWVPPFDLGAAPTARQQAFFDKLAAFADAGGSVLLQDGAIGVMEGYGVMAGVNYASSQTPAEGFMSNGGLIMNGVSSTWDNGNASEATLGQDYSDPAAQFGGIVWTGIGGSKFNWRPRYDRAYRDGVRRMIYSDDASVAAYSSKDNWDFATWRRKDNDPDKGTIYYLGGFHWRRVTAAGFRILMNTLLATQTRENESVTEVSRSSPIIATVDGVETQYTGSYETLFPPTDAPTWASAADDSTFEFPHVEGHLRALDLAQLGTGTTTFEDADRQSGLVLFDAADHLPSPGYTGTGCGFPVPTTFDDCRRVFTNTGSSTDPTETFIAYGNVATLSPLLGTGLTDDEARTLIARINAGKKDGSSYVAALGGIDRSTLAVIEPSPVIPVSRATMAYVGGLDGMLHAICAEAGAGCASAGTELWAFMPQGELSKVKSNTARVDGSPKVADVFGTFPGGKGLRTVLVFQTGNTSPSATYAIDVTDPTQPDVLWEHTTDGPGLGLAMGWVRDNSSIRPLVFLQTNSGTTTPGMVVQALDADDGDVVWTFTQAYPAPRTDGNPEVPDTGVPGGVTLVPSLSGTTIEAVLVPSLWGAVYKLNARTGINEYGQTGGVEVPLFQFTEDFHPVGASVSLYRDDQSELKALIVTGGFADPFAPSGSVWAPDDVHQYAVGFPLAPDASAVPIDQNDVQNEDLGVFIDFGAGQRAFSPAVIAGNELFITTDSQNVNSADFGATDDTGQLWRASLADQGANPTIVTIPSGAAAVDVSLTAGAVVATGGGGVHRDDPTGFASSGGSAEVSPEASGTRRLWLRLR
ncbi:MAG: hypothetical protein H6708_19575 [Kofleriaceae bacterium]|nr:hypothetical protein [Kofleriaceae bacterium]